MNVAYSSSAYYYKPTYISIYSLLKNSSESHRIYLLSSGVSEANKAELKEMVESNGSYLEVLEIESLLEEKARQYRFPIMRGNYSTYARIFLAELLPEVDEILLIDSDTLVLGDVQDIRSRKGGNVMLASRDFVISNVFSNHEDSDFSGKNYWNMGVLYIDLSKWRRLNLTGYLNDNIDREYVPKIADQSIINLHLRRWIDTLDIKYNFYTYFHYGFDYLYYRKCHNKTKFITAEELTEALERPVIVHFIGTWYERPWFRYNISTFKDAYLKYWTECFDKKELLEKPSLPWKNKIYDTISLGVHNLFGVKAYFIFRYRLIQAIKAFS
jgi:lipopolysaccharide biosynthesis glycosyltransferase